MKPLRAYLIVRSNSSDWEVTVHRELESLVDAWKLKKINNETSAVVHVGFWRPEVEAFESILSRYPGIVFLTESARYSWPRPCAIAPLPAGEVDGMRIFAALSGWGYEVAANSLNLGANTDPNLPLDWISTLQKRNPELASEANGYAITDESTYLSIEEDLPSHLRLKLAYSRFHYYCGALPSTENILDHSKYLPPWVLTSPIDSIDLSVRALNIFKEHSINYIGDLAGISSETLMKYPKFGRSTFRDVSNEIFKLLQFGPPEKSDGDFKIDVVPKPSGSQLPTSFIDLISLAFEDLKETQAEVIKQRMGILGKSMTLQEIGDETTPRVTRERIRQIEKKGIQRIKSLTSLATELEKRLQRLLDGRKDSLPLGGIEIFDPWFNRIEELESAFEYLLEKLCEDRFRILRHNGQTYVTTISQESWEECIRNGKHALALASEKTVTEIDAKNIIKTLMCGKGEELFSELWLEVSRWAHFAIGKNEESILVSYGNAAENRVEVVLAESDQPLHYSEISLILNRENGRPLDIRRVHNAAANVSLLFGRGTYGLAKHFPLTDKESRMLVAEVEDIIDGGKAGKQWHCSEILDELEERGLDFEGRLTPYVINIGLKRSKRLADLNRMIWISQSSNLSGSANRIDIHQAIVSILQEEGHAMTSGEIRNKILRARGLNSYFQIQPEYPIIRVGIGTWGLINRDLPFPEERISNLVHEIEFILRKKGRGIHATEIINSVHENADIISKSTDIVFLIGLSQINEKIGVDRGQYFYLREWGESRRLSVKSAIEKAFSNNLSSLSLDELSKILPAILERPIEKMQIRGALQYFGATYDIESGKWTLSTGEISTGDEVYF